MRWGNNSGRLGRVWLRGGGAGFTRSEVGAAEGLWAGNEQF